MRFRFVLQPAVATFVAIRAGLRDATKTRPPFLRSLLTQAGSRWKLLREGLKDIGTVLTLAVILDFLYQLFVLRGVYLLELVFTVSLLAVAPYILIRGPVNRLATDLKGHQKMRNKSGKQ